MKLERIKNSAALNEAAGIALEATWADNSLKQIRIGNLVIALESYTIVPYKVLEWEEIEKYKLTKTVEGMEPQVEYFDSKYDADVAINNLPFSITGKVTQVKVRVPVDGVTPETLEEVPF